MTVLLVKTMRKAIWGRQRTVLAMWGEPREAGLPVEEDWSLTGSTKISEPAVCRLLPG